GGPRRARWVPTPTLVTKSRTVMDTSTSAAPASGRIRAANVHSDRDAGLLAAGGADARPNGPGTQPGRHLLVRKLCGRRLGHVDGNAAARSCIVPGQSLGPRRWALH